QGGKLGNDLSSLTYIFPFLPNSSPLEAVGAATFRQRAARPRPSGTTRPAVFSSFSTLRIRSSPTLGTLAWSSATEKSPTTCATGRCRTEGAKEDMAPTYTIPGGHLPLQPALGGHGDKTRIRRHVRAHMSTLST